MTVVSYILFKAGDSLSHRLFLINYEMCTCILFQQYKKHYKKDLVIFAFDKHQVE